MLLLALLACVELRVPGADDPPWTSWDDAPLTPRVEVRVATWNLESLAAPGTDEYKAVASVLRRLDADVVGLNEIDEGSVDDLATLAAEAGYPVVVVPDRYVFGDIGNAILSRLPELVSSSPDSAELSGDGAAEDLTRLPIVFTGQVPGAGAEITVVVQHWKSGFEEADVFRRQVDAIRTAQAADLGAASDLLVVMGDVNEELEDLPGVWPPFTASPAGLPGDYVVGSDIEAMMGGGGMVYDPFAPLVDRGLQIVDARQRDGSYTTRPTSGRRLDHVFVNDKVMASSLRSEVYDSADEALAGLADFGDPLPYNLSNQAADHLPVLISLRLAETDP